MIATCCKCAENELANNQGESVASTKEAYKGDLRFSFWVERGGNACVVFCWLCDLEFGRSHLTVDAYMRRSSPRFA